MEHDRFAEPVWIYVGLNVPRPLETVGQATVFLDDCPSTLRGLGYAAARDLCGRAMRRDASAAEARTALVAFAERRGILAPSLDEVVAARSLDAPTVAAA